MPMGLEDLRAEDADSYRLGVEYYRDGTPIAIVVEAFFQKAGWTTTGRYEIPPFESVGEAMQEILAVFKGSVQLPLDPNWLQL